MKKRKTLSLRLSYIGNIAIAGMMIITAVDVVGRYFFNHPVLGAYEITEYLMLIMVFSFLAYAQAEKAHIAVDIVFDRMPTKIRTFIYIFDHIMCLLLLLAVTWQGILRIMELKHGEDASTLLKIPDYPFAIFMVIGCFVLSVEYFRDIVRANIQSKEH